MSSIPTIIPDCTTVAALLACLFSPDEDEKEYIDFKKSLIITTSVGAAIRTIVAMRCSTHLGRSVLGSSWEGVKIAITYRSHQVARPK